MLATIRCFMTSHIPKRAGAMGGYRCERCKKAGGSLDDFKGYEGQGYVPAIRPRFQRKEGRTPESISRRYAEPKELY